MDVMTIQENFLNALVKQQKRVSIFLINGIQLKGKIIHFDLYAIRLRDDTHEQLVYKHAIASILPLGH